MLTLVAVLVLAAPVPKPKAVGLDLRDSHGDVLVSAADISGYDWDTHTFMVPKVVKERLVKDTPHMFVVSLDGKPVYQGPFWRSLADEPCPGPVILLGDTPDDQIRIEFNYGGPDPKPDDDVRRNSSIREVLDKAKKLK